MSTSKRLLAMVISIGLAAAAPAATISVNMTDGGGGAGTASAGNTAGAVLAGYWNTIGPDGAALSGTDLASLTDATGANSGVSLVQSSAQGGWYHSPGPSGFSGTIGNTVIENFADTTGSYTYTFNNVNAGVSPVYDVYIYTARAFANTGVTQIDVNGQTQFISNESITGDYAEGGWSSQALAEANLSSGNYVLFENVSLDTLVVGVTALTDVSNGGTVGCISAIQLVAPGSALSLYGRIAYHSYSDYMAAPVDSEDGHLFVYNPDTDSQTKVSAGLPIENAMNPHFSPDGASLVFMAIPSGAARSLNSLEIYTLDLSTSALTRQTSNSVPDEDPKFSPDGSTITWKRQGQVWTMNVDGTSQTQLTFTSDEKSGPNYSPDGSKIVYWSEAASNADLWWMSADGSNPSEIVGNANIQDYYPIYRDADNILYSRSESQSDLHDKIYNYKINGGQSTRLALNMTGVEDADAYPVNSANLVFCSTRPGGDGSYDIYIGRYDNGVVYNLPAANSIHKDLGPSYSQYTYARSIVLLSPINDSAYSAGTALLLTASLAHEGSIWSGADPKVIFSGPESIEYTGLTDDGTQGDVTAGDGIYSKTVTLPSAIGSYAVHAEATSVEPGVTSQVGSATATISITSGTSSPPAFTSDPVVEANATENAAYSSTLADDASDPDSDPMTFSAIGGPSWLTVATDGTLSGTPQGADLGLNSWMVQVSATDGSDTAMLEITVDPAGGGGATDDYANADIIVSGSVGGSYADTQASDNAYESITEVESGGRPSNRHSLLEHKWTANVTGGDSVTFYVEAHKTANSEGDDFVFSYSTDNANFTDMVTVTKTADDNTAQSYTLPSSLSGTVYIRVIDTDRTAGQKVLDTVTIDEMYIRSDGTPPPNQAPSFDSDPVVEINATEDSAYSASIADNASDPESDPMTFSKNSGPTWLSVASNGAISGTPGAGNVGLNSFTVQVDAAGGSDTATLEITVDAAGSITDIYISDIAMSSAAYGGNRHAGVAAITVRDEFGATVSGATVSVDWSGATSSSASGTSDGSGVVVFESGRKKNGGTYTVTVTDATASGSSYNPALNLETSDSITAP